MGYTLLAGSMAGGAQVAIPLIGKPGQRELWQVAFKREGEPLRDFVRGFGWEADADLAVEKVVSQLRRDPDFRRMWGGGYFVPVAVHKAVHVLPDLEIVAPW